MAARPPPPPYGAAGAHTLARQGLNVPQAQKEASHGGRTMVQNLPENDMIRMELSKPVMVIEENNRQEIELLADYYALIRTMEKLEKGYIRGTISHNDYEKECQRLIPRFSTLKECLPTDMQDPATAIPTFMSRYQLKAVAAANRFSIGVPATVASGGGEDSSKPKALFVAEAVQAFITVMDSLRLNMTAVDQIHPITADIVNALNKITTLPPDFEPKTKVKRWLQTLSGMRATEMLDEDQTRQFLFDLESSHQEFIDWLHKM
mmetsp:Transcript_7564/g.11980  ORF Transcript_7564/g.11980 Transcript_7564/m.11980 type:complete len:263 (+) Transcript_7564:29-817(+)